jgi:hypothetical protein
MATAHKCCLLALGYSVQFRIPQFSALKLNGALLIGTLIKLQSLSATSQYKYHVKGTGKKKERMELSAL